MAAMMATSPAAPSVSKWSTNHCGVSHHISFILLYLPKDYWMGNS
jgi:hypothetical protein